MLSLGTLNIAVTLSSGCLGIIYYTLYTLEVTRILIMNHKLILFFLFLCQGVSNKDFLQPELLQAISLMESM